MSDDAAHPPLSDAEFAQRLGACGPFEPEPVLAVGVSGGPDSMALCLLAERWARAHGGKVVALTVDHGLRPESGAEALQVGNWLKGYGIEHHILPWTGEKPARGIQQAARAARYRLLGQYCATRGILHLLVAHHLEDQAETYALRLGRGSGVEGLAGMPPVGRLPEQLADAPLLLRPLLDVPKARLVGRLEAMGQGWITDPSNDLEKYHRVRIRRLLAGDAPGGLTIAAAIKAARAMQRRKAAEESAVIRFLSQYVSIDPAGFAAFDRHAFRRLPEDIAGRSLARLTMLLGGRVYPPRSERLANVMAALRDVKTGGWTLSGCLFEAAADRVLVCREAANCTEVATVGGAEEIFWDRRFRVGFRPEKPLGAEVTVRKLGFTGWCAILRQDPALRDIAIPFRAKLSLPAFFQGDRLLAVPHLGYSAPETGGAGAFSSQFDPARCLSA